MFTVREIKVSQVIDEVRQRGFSVQESFLDSVSIEKIKNAMVIAKTLIEKQIGSERIARAGEKGVVRAPMQFDKIFYDLLRIPCVLQIIDEIISESAILHLQNGFILPSEDRNSIERTFQQSWHRDFPRYLNGFVVSVNVFFALDEFNETNGATCFAPETHQKPGLLAPELLEASAIELLCPSGTMIIFDSTLWHKAGVNVSGVERFAINHQFTQPYFKQQLDYCSLLSQDVIDEQDERTRTILGWRSRPPKSLEEFYQPTHRRTYWPGQG